MGVRTCSVTITDARGVHHTVDVTAESLFEAAALALTTFRTDGWTDAVGPATTLEVEVRNPAVRHSVSVLQIQRWIHGATSSPNERVKKDRLARLLSSLSS
jgi:hypothetical protein